MHIAGEIGERKDEGICLILNCLDQFVDTAEIIGSFFPGNNPFLSSLPDSQQFTNTAPQFPSPVVDAPPTNEPSFHDVPPQLPDIPSPKRWYKKQKNFLEMKSGLTGFALLVLSILPI